jgi:hypothetical protein
MTKYLLLAMIMILAVSEGVVAREPIIKKYQNDMADSGVGGAGSRQDGALNLAMGPVSAPQLPGGSPNNSPPPSSGCSSSGDPCTNRHMKTPIRHKHHQ